MEHQAITVTQFVKKMMQYKNEVIGAEDSVSYSYQHGWLEEQDVTSSNFPIERKTAARILHQFLRKELQEQDEPDVSEATKLQDLYECRVCVSHVMQVYVKGIMDGHTTPTGCFVFGMQETITEQEAEKIIERVFHPEKRKPKTRLENVFPTVESISVETAKSMLQADKNAILIDVRTATQYEESHMEKAIHIPLMELLKNPYGVSMRRDIPILLYCEEGYQSEMAAKCLLEAGFEKVYSFAWK